MARRTAQHLRDHLSVFDADFPIQKGYIARLIKNEKRSTADIVAEVQRIVQTALPNKRVNEGSLHTKVNVFKKFVMKHRNLSVEWPKLIEVFIQPFPITYRHLLVEPQTGPTSPSQHSEPISNELAPETSLESHTPQTSTFTPFLAPVNLPSISVLSESPSPKILKKDCPKCVTLRRTIMNMTRKNRLLVNEIKELKKQMKQNDQKQSKLPRKRLNEIIKRKTQLAEKRKAKLIDLSEKFEDEIKLKSLDLWQQRTHALQAALTYSGEENKALNQTNQQLTSMLEKQNKKLQKMKEKHSYFQKTSASNGHEPS